MKYCSKCGQAAQTGMVMCASCGNRSFSDHSQNPNPGVNARSEQSSEPYLEQTIVPSGWLELPVTPWRRYAARLLDLTVFGLLGFFIIGFILYSIAPYTADQFFAIFDAPAGIFLDTIMTTFIGSLLTGAIIGVSGLSLGKFIFGVIVTDSNGMRIGISNGIQRDLSVFLRGLGLGIPIIGLITMIVAFNRLKKTNYASWDEEKNYRVWSRPTGFSQYILNTIGILLLILATALVQMLARL